MSNARILIVEDDVTGAARLEECLKNLGYMVCAVVSGGLEAIEKARQTRPDLALVDLELEGEVSGPETAERIGSRLHVPVVFLTDKADLELLQRAQASRPYGYVQRPLEARQLHLNILTAVSMAERERGHRETKTRLKRIIRKYKDLIRLMKAVFNSMSEGVIAINENKIPIFNNSSARKMGGENPLDKDIHTWAEKYGLYKPDGETIYNVEESPVIAALNGQATDPVEMFVRNETKPEGVHVSLDCSPLWGSAGDSKGALIVLRDITWLKKAEARLERTVGRLQDQTRLMETVFDSMSEAVLVIDENGEPLIFNSSSQEMLGVSVLEGEMKGWAARYGVHESDGERFIPILPRDDGVVQRALRGKATEGIELLIRNEQRPDGIYVRTNVKPLEGKKGR